MIKVVKTIDDGGVLRGRLLSNMLLLLRRIDGERKEDILLSQKEKLENKMIQQ